MPHVERGVVEREGLGVGHLAGDGEPVGLRAEPPLLEERGHVVGGRDVGEVAGRGERGVAVPRRDVEDPVGGAEVDRLAEPLADDLELDSDPAKVPRGPRGLLPGLHGAEVGGGTVRDLVHGTLLA